jgi:hypothetical protein
VHWGQSEWVEIFYILMLFMYDEADQVFLCGLGDQ